MKEAIKDTLRKQNDPAMHVIDELESWPERQYLSEAPPEAIQAKRAFDLILFSVHERKLIPVLRDIAISETVASTPPALHQERLN